MAGTKNVLLLIADDWSPLAGCYGSPVIRTPHVDELARRATRFTHAYCTSPSSADSRANILTERQLGDEQGRVQALQAVRVEWKSIAGRMTMERIPGSEFTIKVDLVLLAMGFIGPVLEGLLHDLGVQISVRGQHELRSPAEMIEQLRKRESMYSVHAGKDFMTSEPGVFVAGDAKRGASLVVWASWEGREAARCIDEYLMGVSELPTTPQAEALL